MTLFNPLTADSIVVNLKQKDMNGIVAGSVSNILQEIPARHSSFHTIAPFLIDGIWKFLQTNFFFSIMKLFLMGLSLIVLWCFVFVLKSLEFQCIFRNRFTQLFLSKAHTEEAKHFIGKTLRELDIDTFKPLHSLCFVQFTLHRFSQNICIEE